MSLHQSQRWDLRSLTIAREMTAADVTNRTFNTWRQILYELDEAWATMEWQVHIWITNSKFRWKYKYWDQLTSPAKSIMMISFYRWRNLKNHERWRTTIRLSGGLRVGCRHDLRDLSDEEKKNTSDDFELHLELADSRNIAALLIYFFLLVVERRNWN
jgi:hypothetical protein